MKRIEDVFWLGGVLLLTVYVGAQAWSASEQERSAAVGQMGYINEPAMPFQQLPTNDSFNLHVPEGEYGFAIRPGVVNGQPAAVVPQTASPLPWFGFGGLLALFSGLLLTALRKHVPLSG